MLDAAHSNVIATSYELRAAGLKAEKSFIALRAELSGEYLHALSRNAEPYSSWPTAHSCLFGNLCFLTGL